jgi:hypothetical protein
MLDFTAEVRRVVGPALTEEELGELVTVAYSDLELAVGRALSAGLSDEQLAEFGELVDREDDDGANQWLKTHRPDYPSVVTRELGLLLGRVAKELGTQPAIGG